MSASLLAQAAETGSHTGETVLFWIIAPLAVLSALGLVIAPRRSTARCSSRSQ